MITNWSTWARSNHAGIGNSQAGADGPLDQSHPLWKGGSEWDRQLPPPRSNQETAVDGSEGEAGQSTQPAPSAPGQEMVVTGSTGGTDSSTQNQPLGPTLQFTMFNSPEAVAEENERMLEMGVTMSLESFHVERSSDEKQAE